MKAVYTFDLTDEDDKIEHETFMAAKCMLGTIEAVLRRTREILKYDAMAGKSAYEAAEELRALVHEELGPWVALF